MGFGCEDSINYLVRGVSKINVAIVLSTKLETPARLFLAPYVEESGLEERDMFMYLS